MTFPQRSRFALVSRACAGLALVAAVLPSVTAAQDHDDSVLDGVRSMLEKKLSEEVILRWLDASPSRPALPTPDDLIALRDLGASDTLLTRILDLAAPSPSGAGVSSPVPEPPPAHRPMATSILRETADPDSSGDGTPVLFRLSYRPEVEEDEEEWALYVYLDGKPLSFVPASSLLSRSRSLAFERRLAPGRHELRVAQERHVRRFRSWFHAARVFEQAFVFDLAADGPAEIELSFKQSALALAGGKEPLSFRFIQGDEIQLQQAVGGDPEDWPLLCEEVESRAKDGKLKRADQRKLEGCVRWASLWSTSENVPPRDEIREGLALFDYRPIPRNERSDP